MLQVAEMVILCGDMDMDMDMDDETTLTISDAPSLI